MEAKDVILSSVIKNYGVGCCGQNKTQCCILSPQHKFYQHVLQNETHLVECWCVCVRTEEDSDSRIETQQTLSLPGTEGGRDIEDVTETG